MKNLSTIRKKRGLTQKELSDISGVSQQCIHSYETGRTMPSCETLVCLAKILDTSTDYLLELTKIDTPPYHIAEDELDTIEAFVVNEMRSKSKEYSKFVVKTIKGLSDIAK